MPLAAFPLIIRRWRRSILFSGNYAQYQQLREYLPEDIFLTRLATLENHVLKEYPHVWIDTIMFFIAIIFVIITAVFSIVARAANLSLWYPLIVLVVPAVIAFFTTRRRNSYYQKLAKYYESLQSILKEMNSLDVTRQIKWSFRRLRETDTPVSMHLQPPIQKYNINFVIEVIQINTENELAEEGEILPAYDTSMMDVVLDIGPEVEELPGNRSDYISPPPQAQTSSSNGGNRRMVLSHPLPPAYEQDEEREENHESIELEPIHPPPAYLNESADNIPTPNTSNTTTATTTMNNNH